MALLVVKGPDGRGILIHSSQIGPDKMPIRSIGEWRDVWARLDKARGAS